MKCYLISLGCPKNLVDSEIMLGLIQEAGHELTYSEEEAEIIIINTCCFIEKAKEESINTILEMALLKTTGICKHIIVTGCLAQKYSKDLSREIPEIDAFIGTGEIHNIVNCFKKLEREKFVKLISSPKAVLTSTLPRIVTTPFYYGYLKIAEGCSHRCNFCIIPQVRGRYTSRQPEEIINEARVLSEKGVKELILIAQDTSNYGKDINKNLVNLLIELEKLEKIKWIRLLYLYPSTISKDLLELIKSSEKICRYIDIPLQHCDEEILKNMGRAGNKEELLNLLNNIRETIPDVTIRTSLITGFPGEREEQFESLMDFVEKARFDRLGAFEYSKEEGTKAAKLKGQIRKSIKKARLHKLMTLQKNISLEKNKSLIGSVQEVIVEEINEGKDGGTGRTRRDAPDIDGQIYLVSSQSSPGDIIKAEIINASEYDLIGREM